MANTPPTDAFPTTALTPPEQAVPPPQAAPEAQPVIDTTAEVADVDFTERVFSPKEIMDAVRQDLGLDVEDYTAIPEFERVTYGTAKWEVGKGPPGRDDLAVFFIGIGKRGDRLSDHVEGDYRVYVRPLQAGNAKAGDWRVYTFNRAHPGADSVAKMSQATWIESIVHEKRVLAEDFEILESDEKIEAIAEAVEEERDRCAGWLKANALDNAAKRMVAQLEVEDEEEGDEDDEDEDEDDE